MRMIFLLLLISSTMMARSVDHYHLNNGTPTSGPIGNSITDLQRGNNCLWIGAGDGLGRYVFSTDSFESFLNADDLARGSISAIFTAGDTIWIAAAADSFVSAAGESLPYGTGFSVSIDNGQTWRRFPQPGPTPIQNLCYDITVVDNVVWGASFGGGLLKSQDWGQSWEQTAPDTLVFDPNAYLNHRAFSLLNADNVLWVGTAGGINKSTDNGKTWQNFNARNQQNPISGDFVVALAYQKTDDKKIIWAATWKAEDLSESYGLSKSENGGLTWSVCLKDIKVQNIGVDGNVVYAATHEGLYKSPDFGENWYKFTDIEDKNSGERLYTTEYYSCYGENGSIWAGSADGLALSSDNGYRWQIYRAFKSTGKAGEPRTYAYPNPFSSKRHNELNGQGHIRLQYSVNADTYVAVKIYDFALDWVATICEGKFRQGPGDYAEVWDGKNQYRDDAANGVYFYSVAIENDGVYWGKILLVN
ncbi:MAG: hypothetical protein EHM72_13380 [Calditrichaeota bacterium]|nr:MAG: hypothetical protein EHM72_13380 [Calditrichota bacterium]